MLKGSLSLRADRRSLSRLSHVSSGQWCRVGQDRDRLCAVCSLKHFFFTRRTSAQTMASSAGLRVPVASIGPFGDSPAQVMCPNCQQMVVTRVEFTAGLLSYLSCGGLFFCGFVLGCCLIPFCVDRLRDAKHFCPNCKSLLGLYKRL